MQKLIGTLVKQQGSSDWIQCKNQNRDLIATILRKSKDRLYQYEPYYNRRGGKPGWQWRFLEAAGSYNARVALGSNRCGKSDQGAYESWLAITGQHPYRDFPTSGKGWIVAHNHNFLRDINLPKFETFMPWEYSQSSQFNKQDKIWQVDNGERSWQVQFKSADAGRRAFEGDDIDYKQKLVDIDLDTEDDYSRTFNIEIPEDAEAGIYLFGVKTFFDSSDYNDDDYNDVKDVVLTVRDFCNGILTTG